MIYIVEPNQKYGRLTTICVVGKTKDRANIWKCICDCGNYVNVRSQSLTSGNTKSCGCLQRERVGKKSAESRLLNKYDLSGEYGIGYATNGEEFYFDLEDYMLIKDYTWSINDAGYVTSNPFGKHLRMHMLVMNKKDRSDGKDIDHINHNTKDNRKENLRIIEHYQNITHCITYSNNTSGRKGVSWDKSRSKWMATITYNKKTYHLGRFENFEDAVRAREDAEKRIHKEFHYDEPQNEERDKAIS